MPTLMRITPGFWLAALALVGPTATVFSIRIMGTLPIIAAAATAATWAVRRDTRPTMDRPVVVGVAAILATCAVSGLWGPADAYIVERLIKLSVLFLAGLVLFHAAGRVDEPDRRTLSICLVSGYGIASVLLAAEVGTDSLLFRWLTGLPPSAELTYRPNRPLVTLMLLTWPVLAIVDRHFGRNGALAGLAIVCVVGIMLAWSTSQTALLAFVAGGTVWLAARWLPTLSLYAVVGGLVVAVAAMPWLVEILATLPDPAEGSILAHASVGPRLDIWAAVTEQIWQHPFIGLGLEGLRLATPDGKIGGISGANHPHNAALQIRVEFGVIGLVMASALLVGVGLRVGGLPRSRRRLPITLLASFGTVSLVSHGLWQSWWIGTICAVIAISLAVSRQ